MKNKLLIIIGSLLFFIALISNIIDIRSLINLNLHNLSNEFHVAIKKINFDSNYLSSEEIPSQDIYIIESPDLMEISPAIQDDDQTKTPVPDGFLPLQLEKKRY
jgi:hypothetical protein